MNRLGASSPQPSPPQVCGGEGEEARRSPSLPNLRPASGAEEPRFRGIKAVGIKQNAFDLGKGRLGKEFGQILNEMRAAAAGNALDFRLLGQFQKNLGAGQADQGRVEETLLLQPVERRLMEIVALAQKRMPGFVADDAGGNSRAAAGRKKLQHARIRRRFRHAGAIDAALHFRPGLLPADAPQMIAHFRFVDRQIGRRQTAFPRHAMKHRVVTDHRVVKINPDHAAQACSPSPRESSGRIPFFWAFFLNLNPNLAPNLHGGGRRD